MNANQAAKLWTLASHPTTNENEAMNAFNMLRKATAESGGLDEYMKSLFGTTSGRSASHWEALYNRTRDHLVDTVTEHKERITAMEQVHAAAIRTVNRRITEVQAELMEKKAEIAALRESGTFDDYLGRVAAKEAEITTLTIRLRELEEAGQRNVEADERLESRVVAAETERDAAVKELATLRATLAGLAGSPKPKEDDKAEAVAEPVKPKRRYRTAPTAKPKPRKSGKRKMPETDSIVESQLTNQFKTVRELVEGAIRRGFRGTDNAIRFAAERLARDGVAEQGQKDGKLAFLRA